MRICRRLPIWFRAVSGHSFKVGAATSAAAVAATLAVLAGPVLTLPGSGAPRDCASAASTATSSAAQASTRVGLVVDYGLLAAEQGAPAAPRVECVVSTAGSNGFQVLQAGGHTFRVNASGLLCAIDGYPSGNECGERRPEGYRYWAYFRSTGSWAYSGIGPGASRPGPGSVEGWHFVLGAGNPTDPAPNGPADSTLICPPPPAPTTAAPPAVPPSAPVPPVQGGPSGPGGGGGGGGGGSGPTMPTSGANGPGPGANPAASGPAGAPKSVGPGNASGSPDGSSPGAGSIPDGTASTAPVIDPSAGGAVDPNGTALGPGAPAPRSDGQGVVEIAAAPASDTAALPVGAILAIIGVVLLGGAAAVRLRSRPEGEA